MGWAARANATVRDGQRPARLTHAAPARVSPLLVFRTSAIPAVDREGRPVIGIGGRQRVYYSVGPDVAPGAALTDEHYFDGVSVRRFGKLNGKDAKRQRIAARRAATGGAR